MADPTLPGNPKNPDHAGTNPDAGDTPPLLEIRDLEVTFALRTGPLKAIDGVSFTLDKGERIGIVGESGAGKSVTGFAVIDLISPPGRISGGHIRFQGRDIRTFSSEEIRQLRGNRISMIFQDPMMTLNPVLTIGAQMVETLMAHRKITRKQAEEISLDRLEKVRIPSPGRRLKQYPHEFSGGMRQRIVIAIALLSDPSLIIADEPTTALDVTIQADIMELLLDLCESEQMALMLITHDLGVVSQVTRRIAVMYAGRIVEMGPTADIVRDARHPYTVGLIRALPGERGQGRGKPLHQIPGVMPSLAQMPPGCPFHPRCDRRMDICDQVIPPPLLLEDGKRMTACHLYSS